MAYVAVDKNGRESICSEKPFRHSRDFWDADYMIELHKGSVEKLIGKKLTWEDEPVELKEKNEK